MDLSPAVVAGRNAGETRFDLEAHAGRDSRFTTDHERVRAVLAAHQPRQSEMLLLRPEGLNYEELASSLDLRPGLGGDVA